MIHMVSCRLRRFVRALLPTILGALFACSNTTPPSSSEEVPAATAAPSASTVAATGQPIVRARSRWVPARWSDLPGWESDRSAELWMPLRRGCEKPPAGWAEVCERARAGTPADDASARAWLQAHLQPFRVEARDGVGEGLITGYFEPLVEASRLPRAGFRVPLYGPPADLDPRRPWSTRREIDGGAAPPAALKGRELVWVADPLDALVLQIQGSGRLRILEPDGSRRLVRVAFAAHNGQPYRSVSRWLVERGELRLDQASWPAIRQWAASHPERVNEMLWSNPRYVFFREEPLPDPALGPKGAQSVPLTPGRSIAVDPQSIPYGTIAWLDTTEPLSSLPLRRAVMAQDTGSAIVGAVRADYFWGWGADAEASAGRMKQPLRLWVLWPKGSVPAP